MRYKIFSMRRATASRGSVSGSRDSCISSWLLIQAALCTVHCMTGIQFKISVVLVWQHSFTSAVHIPASVYACSFCFNLCTWLCSFLFIMSFYFTNWCGVEFGCHFNTCWISATTCTGWMLSKLEDIGSCIDVLTHASSGTRRVTSNCATATVFCNCLTLTFDLSTSGSMQAERLL